jgi:hypothetical protein
MTLDRLTAIEAAADDHVGDDPTLVVAAEALVLRYGITDHGTVRLDDDPRTTAQIVLRAALGADQ